MFERLVDVVERHAEAATLARSMSRKSCGVLERNWVDAPCEAWPGGDGVDQVVGLALQGGEAEPAAVLDHELVAAGGAQARESALPNTP